jgi:hypothetical protein
MLLAPASLRPYVTQPGKAGTMAVKSPSGSRPTTTFFNPGSPRGTHREGDREFQQSDQSNKTNSAKISPALADPRLNLSMASNRLACCNAGAISWVPVVISTTYWVPVLTMLTLNRKVSTSATAGLVFQNRQTDRCNHLSKPRSTILEFARLRTPLGRRSSVLLLPLSAKGECCA